MCLSTFLTYLCGKFHMPSCYSTCVIATKLTENFCMTTILLFYILQKFYCVKS